VVRAGRLAACMAAIALLVATLPGAQAIPNTKCPLSTPVQDVAGVADLPPVLQELLPPIADIAAPFNNTDAVLDPSLPFRRLIRAGHSGQDWFLWYEHGGITYFWQAVVAHVPTDGTAVTTLANIGTISDILCVVTDGALTGRMPPYPPEVWAESSF